MERGVWIGTGDRRIVGTADLTGREVALEHRPINPAAEPPNQRGVEAGQVGDVRRQPVNRCGVAAPAHDVDQVFARGVCFDIGHIRPGYRATPTTDRRDLGRQQVDPFQADRRSRS